MRKNQVHKLQKEYNNFLKVKRNSRNILSFFTSFMPEMLYRTFKLEGEIVTRVNIASLFG